MNKPIYVGLTTAKTLRILIAVILVVIDGRVFNAGAQTETNLHIFAGFPGDGSLPFGGLVQGSDSNFYGATYTGGVTNNFGTVFRISPNGALTILYSFAGPTKDGFQPYATLVQGNDGNFYGTTSQGGSVSGGIVFRISPNGTETNLYSFGSHPGDGVNSQAGLVQGSDGNFYGTTFQGGAHNSGGVFRVSPSGAFTNLYFFGSHPSDGANTQAGLVQGTDGSFYGTTSLGGVNNKGIVFRISPSGAETNLYSFIGPPNDGDFPAAGLVQGSDGNFYGTTSFGGMNNKGIAFRISPSDVYTNLYSFIGSTIDGQQPNAGLVQGSDGNFYGTTLGGGSHSAGTIFRISPSGAYTNLYSFVGSTNDGQQPDAVLVQGMDGNLYGTAHEGGPSGFGSVFKLTVPLSPPPYPINQITGAQLSGTNIVFMIPSIAYETYQLQFSSSMNPTNWANVPGGSVTNSIGALLTLTNFGGASQPQGFYRFDITP